MDQEEAPPPPYSAVDPLLAPGSQNGPSQQTTAQPQGNYTGSQNAGSSQVAPLPIPAPPTVVPTHFTSAVAYFEERPSPTREGIRETLHHHMTIYPRSQAKDFPRRPRCWAPRTDEVIQQDWDAFLRYLFPPELGPAAASQDLPRQLRAEIQRDRKDRPQESDEQRYARIVAVIEEWNENFFEPRAARLDFVYIAEPDTAPKSALCPYCYPAATKATNTLGIPNPASIQSQWSASPAPGRPLPGQWPMQYGPVPNNYGAPQTHMPPFNGAAFPPGYRPPHYYPGQPPPPGFNPVWQWNNPAYIQAQQTNSGSKGGLSGFISNISAQAQKYGERFAEQAQQYGDQISAHAMYYGRQVEEQAMLRGRWIEEQAGLSGQKPGAYPPAGYYPYPWGPPPPGVSSAPGPRPPSQSPTPSHPTESQHTPPTQNKPEQQGKLNVERSRRTSVSSTASDSSLSSLESLQTTSDLSASDLENIRTQLQTLHDRHDRTLYDAAADLRRQLNVLQDSRREAKTSGRINRRNGWNRPQNQPVDRNDWGRWDSPAQQQRQSMERRAMKDELGATRKAFHDVVHRAREDQRDRRRKRKNLHRQEQTLRESSEGKETHISLSGNLGQLSLSDASTSNSPSNTARPQTSASSSYGRPGPGSVPSASGSQSGNSFPAELPDRKAKPGKTRLRDKLMPRASKQQNATGEVEDAKAKAKREADEAKARSKKEVDDNKSGRKKEKDASGS